MVTRQELLNPKSGVYEENKYFLRPGESLSDYYTRNQMPIPTIGSLGYASPDDKEIEGFNSEMGIASSSRGADIVNNAKTSEAKMTLPPVKTETTKTTTAP